MMPPKSSKQSQGTIALFLWFAFFNAQLLLLILLGVQWRLSTPVAPFQLWNPALAEDPLALGLMVMAMSTAGLGLGLAFRFFAALRAAAETPGSPPVASTLYIISLAVLETTGMYGVILGFLRGPATIGAPFILLAMALMAVVFPSGRRFPNRGD